MPVLFPMWLRPSFSQHPLGLDTLSSYWLFSNHGDISACRNTPQQRWESWNSLARTGWPWAHRDPLPLPLLTLGQLCVHREFQAIWGIAWDSVSFCHKTFDIGVQGQFFLPSGPSPVRVAVTRIQVSGNSDGSQSGFILLSLYKSTFQRIVVRVPHAGKS